MVALVGILLLCGFILFITDFASQFTSKHETAVWIGGFSVCALLLIGFYVF